MKIHELSKSKGRKTSTKRLGRGSGSGQGTTAGRGMNGQNSRSGGGVRPGFEGGQMPLFRRLPQLGFNNKRFAKVWAEVNISRLNQFENGATVGPKELIEAGIIKKVDDGVKIMGFGTFSKNLNVQAQKFTKSAIEKIEAAGGKAEVI
ncbi:MAG: 50S ribosomal protein L15 [Bacillota bacterium]|nr:50S ribosomal protein L15 [Bacillota bacterium]